MSYLNLACLLMTLVCLITIVLFSTSAGEHNHRLQQQQQQSSSPRSAAARLGQQSLLGARKSPGSSSSGEPSSADQDSSLAEPSSQPLVSAANSKDDSLFDDSASANSAPPTTTDYPDASLWLPRNRSADQNAPKQRRKSGPEREIEESSGGSSSSSSADSSSAKDEPATSTSATPPAASSLLEPLLSQISEDLDLGPMFKAVLDESSKHSLRPIIKRSKNGATIIISSSSNEFPLADNETSSSLPGLLRKLMPPMLFRRVSAHSKEEGKFSSPLSPPGGDNLAGSATITISGRAIDPLEMSPILGAPFGGLMAPLLGSSMSSSFSSPAQRNPFRAFFPEPMGFRMNSLVSAPSQFAALPFPSSLGLMLRSMAASAEDEPQQSAPASRSNSSKIEEGAEKASNIPTNETLSPQASQQQAATVGGSKQQQAAAENKAQQQSSDPEVETFDVSQLAASPFRLSPASHQLHRAKFVAPFVSSPPLGHQHSVMIFGSSLNPETGLLGGNSGLPMPMPLPMPMSMSMHMPQHVMMLANGINGPSSGAPGLGSSSSLPMPFNPLLRSILSSLASGTSAADSDEKNKTGVDRSDQETIRIIRPIFMPAHEMGDSDNSVADSRQALASDNMRARQNRMDSMLADEIDSAGGMENNAGSDLPGAQEAQAFEQGALIRQTIRGPAMTVERIIEVPATAQQQQQVQQVPRGLRSLSISRAVAEETSSESSSASEAPAKLSPSRQNQFSSMERREDDSPDGAIMMPHRMSFIGKILSDLSRRAASPRMLLGQPDIDDRMGTAEEQSNVVGKSNDQPPWGPPKILGDSATRGRVARTSAALPAGPNNDLFSRHQIPQSSSPQASNGDQDGSNMFEAPEESGRQISLEDTLNSMEDRLDRVLSMATQYTSTPGSHRAIITPIEKPNTMAHEHQLHQTTSMNSQAKADNPYTSPTSPLFGFPASPMAQIDQATPIESDKKPARPEPRSAFTYHSNNELALNLKMAALQQREPEAAEMRADPVSGKASKFGLFLSPPAGAMGRRLDDGPFGDSSMSTEEQQQQQEQPGDGAPAVGPVAGPTFLEGRAMMPATGSHVKKPEATNQFRTIVV